MQLCALILDTYRSLKARSLFWVVLWISVVLVLVFASFGCNEKGWYLGFGLSSIDSEFLRTGTLWEKSFLIRLLWMLIDWWLMTFAVLLALFPASTIFPDALRPGAVDLLLAKGVSRFKFFLGKYFGGLLFVVMQAFIVCLGVFLTLLLRLHQPYWTVFFAVGLTVLIFSFVFCVNVLLGILTGNSVAALLMSILFWATIAGVQFYHAITVHEAIQVGETMGESGKQLSAAIMAADSTVEKVMWFLPKTRATGDLASRIIRADAPYTFHEIILRSATQNEEKFEASRGVIRLTEEVKQKLEHPVWFTIGTSLAFEAVVLLLAFWRLARMDF